MSETFILDAEESTLDGRLQHVGFIFVNFSVVAFSCFKAQKNEGKI